MSITGAVRAATQVGQWSPLLAGDIVAEWLDPQWGVVASGGVASAWTGRMGATFVQSTGSSKPGYDPTLLNGRGAFTFDSTDDEMTCVGVPATWPTGAAPGWIVAIVDQQALAAAPGARVAFGYGATSANAGRRVDRYVPGGVNRLEVSNASTDAPETTVDFSGFHTAMGIYTATTQTPRISGVEGSPGAATINTGTSRARLGANQGVTPVNYWHGAIGDVLILRAEPPLALKQLIEGWSHWVCDQQARLPTGHPYRNRRP